MPAAAHTDDRELLQQFAVCVFPDAAPPEALPGDAGVRRYYRIRHAQGSAVLMDSRADGESLRRFVALGRIWHGAGLPVPEIYRHGDGLLLLEDFGTHTLDGELQQTPEKTLAEALMLLGRWQQRAVAAWEELPPYNATLLREELSRFSDWFFPHFLDRRLSGAEMRDFDCAAAQLIALVSEQPTVCVHRDFHCRNLMRRADGGIGILDFQDAVRGAAAYDLLSLTRDCYLRYDDELRRTAEEAFRRRHFGAITPADWQRQCHAVSLQRHLKVLGLFVRLAVRDKKTRYLADLPRVWGYAREEAAALADEIPFIDRLLASVEQQTEALFRQKEA